MVKLKWLANKHWIGWGIRITQTSREVGPIWMTILKFCYYYV